MTDTQHEDVLHGIRLIPFIAPPNGGKGTQTAALSERLNLPKFDMGAQLRVEARSETELGARIRERQDKGMLVDIAIVVDVLKSGLTQLAEQHPDSKAIILDGFPRSGEQTDRLFELARRHHMPIPLAVYLDVPRDVIMERAVNRRLCPTCGNIYNTKFRPPQEDNRCDRDGTELIHRVDDHAEPVATRLKTFDDETAPILQAFDERGILKRVNGNRNAELITEELIGLLEAALHATV